MMRLPVPAEPWVDRLRRDHIVWLPKEAGYARVDFAYEPPEPGGRFGRIALSRLPHYPDGPAVPAGAWYIGLRGEGLDGRQLIEPVEGHLPAEATKISEPVVRHLHREIERLNNLVDRMWRALDHHGLLDFENVLSEAFQRRRKW